MVKLSIEPATPHDLALFKCPGAKCSGFLVPYEVWRSKKTSTVFATCYSCKRRYKFELPVEKSDDWLSSLRNFTWRCPFCGEPGLDVKRAVGNRVFRVQGACSKCGKASTKKIERRTYDVLVAGLSQRPEEVATVTDDKEPAMVGSIAPAGVPVKKVYIICPACQLEIEEAFKGYCPACGFVFSAIVEDKP